MFSTRRESKIPVWLILAGGAFLALLLLTPKKAKGAIPEGGLESVRRWQYIYVPIGLELGVPPALIAAIIHVESRGDPTAAGMHGEYGLMQILCSTARQMGFKGACPELLNPYVNIYYGTKYLRWQFERYGDWEKAISAYNAGSFTLRNRKYVEKVLAAWEIYSR